MHASVEARPTDPTGGASVFGSSSRRFAKRHWAVGAPLAASVLALVLAVVLSPDGSGRLTDPRFAAPPGAVQHLLSELPQDGFVLGRPNAPVTVTEFDDLQCGACDLYMLTLFPRIVSEFVRSGKVKLVLRDMAFVGSDSVTAARAATAAAYQDKLWGFVAAFYFRQEAPNSGYVTDAFLRQVGEAVPGLDVARLMRARRSSATLAPVDAATELAKENGIAAAPTFVITAGGTVPVRVEGDIGLEEAIENAVIDQ